MSEKRIAVHVSWYFALFTLGGILVGMFFGTLLPLKAINDVRFLCLQSRLFDGTAPPVADLHFIEIDAPNLPPLPPIPPHPPATLTTEEVIE